MRNIAILGTGWLGLPLAEAFIENGFTVNGSTTTENRVNILQEKGISAHQIALQETGPEGDISAFLKNTEILIINIPPGLRRNPEVNFVSKIHNLIPHIESSNVKNVLFISSTSVFADVEGFPVTSNETLPNATSNAGKQLIETEHLLQKNTHFSTTVLRFAGLFGPNRHPATMLSKRKNIKNPKAPVNLIHLEDCIGVIKKIIETSCWNEVLNACYPDHPEKAKYYGQVCESMGFPAPDYDFETPSKGKLIDSQYLMKKLKYTFKKQLMGLPKNNF
ncbi:NAD-dependent epimerase/dehydratase family protein [Aquimarina sp. D1M17]|uniref:NAD-dependent epimerase/dehydratase family protein n=1 Tax=Aquimarina acroporae TaxID=2937283 RepID=UPI0020BD77B5|nr:NAD-dependent epimerase/dehydratase family protein [Aquimarina acroporae]MCK8523753.1 NAD-dependent epimerase/dehydratase family protein [Aquimarina acroporae]